MKFITHTLTSQGGREYNEDSVLINKNETGITAVVADGLGGHGGGDVASKVAAEILCECSDIDKEVITEHFNRANASVMEKQTDKCQMKSTAVMLVCSGEKFAVAHIGDSRCYHFREKKVLSQTTDHSVSQLAVAAGDIKPKDIRFHEDRNKLFRCLGAKEKIKPEITVSEEPIKAGDAFLLCTDGFWEYVTEKEMCKDLSKANTPEKWVENMLKRINKRVDGKHDNLSAIAVFCTEN